MKDNLKTLTIDRKKWYRGEGTDWSALIVDDCDSGAVGEMCCLGFECKARNVPKKRMIGIGTPAQLAKKLDIKISGLVTVRNKDTKWCEIAMALNDETSLTDTDREQKLIAHFAKRNIKLKFIN